MSGLYLIPSSLTPLPPLSSLSSSLSPSISNRPGGGDGTKLCGAWERSLPDSRTWKEELVGVGGSRARGEDLAGRGAHEEEIATVRTHEGAPSESCVGRRVAGWPCAGKELAIQHRAGREAPGRPCIWRGVVDRLRAAELLARRPHGGGEGGSSPTGRVLRRRSRPATRGRGARWPAVHGEIVVGQPCVGGAARLPVTPGERCRRPATRRGRSSPTGAAQGDDFPASGAREEESSAGHRHPPRPWYRLQRPSTWLSTPDLPEKEIRKKRRLRWLTGRAYCFLFLPLSLTCGTVFYFQLL
jgi:hypothetical protein